MAMSIMNVTMIGRATKDVEMRTVNGKSGPFEAATVNIAVDRPYNAPKAADGSPITDFWRCESTGGNAKYAQHIKKGMLLALVGYFYNPEPYTNKDGALVKESCFRIEDIRILEKRQDGDNQGGNNYNQNNNGDNSGYYNNNGGYGNNNGGYNNNNGGYGNQGAGGNNQNQNNGNRGGNNQNQNYGNQNQNNDRNNQNNYGNNYSNQNNGGNNQNNNYGNQGNNYGNGNQGNQNNGFNNGSMNPPEGFGPAVEDPFGLNGGGPDSY